MAATAHETDVFRAVAEPTRRALLGLVAKGPKTASELIAKFDLTQQAISHHLQILSSAGLLTVSRVGRFRYYRLRAKPLAKVYRWSRAFKPLFDPAGHAWIVSDIEEEE
jgi:DNA-binding transcriptional ArsR family regulator